LLDERFLVEIRLRGVVCVTHWLSGCTDSAINRALSGWIVYFVEKIWDTIVETTLPPVIHCNGEFRPYSRWFCMVVQVKYDTSIKLLWY
jgi:hypothetical protein